MVKACYFLLIGFITTHELKVIHYENVDVLLTLEPASFSLEVQYSQCRSVINEDLGFLNCADLGVQLLPLIVFQFSSSQLVCIQCCLCGNKTLGQLEARHFQ